jgi:hypothetical protein
VGSPERSADRIGVKPGKGSIESYDGGSGRVAGSGTKGPDGWPDEPGWGTRLGRPLGVRPGCSPVEY